MAITATVLTDNASTSNVTSYTTASISPTSGRVLLAFVTMSGIGAAVATTITGLSGTWTNLTGSNRPAGLGTYDLAAFTCTDYTGSGTLAIANSDSATSCAWVVIEIDGANTTTPTVTAALKKVNLGSVSTGTVTLDSPAAADNRAFVAYSCNNNTAAQAAPRTNWTELCDRAISTPGIVLEAQWRSDTYETTSSVTYTGGPYTAGAVAVEISAAVTGATVDGTADASLGALTATAAGAPVRAGTADATLGGLTADATGVRTVTAATAAELGALTGAATGIRGQLLGQVVLDDFNDNTFNTGAWARNDATQVTETGGRLRVSTLVAGGYFGVTSVATVSFSGAAYGARLITPGNRTYASLDVYAARLDVDANNSAYWYLNQTSLVAYTKTGGSTFTQRGATLTFDDTIHRYFAIRDIAGTLEFLWSTDGAIWWTHASVANPLGGTTATVVMQAGTWATEAATTDIEWDDYSLWAPGTTGTAAASLGGLTASATGLRSVVTGPRQHLAWPAYVYPTTGDHWARFAATHPTGTFLIANPASGPGATADSNYTAAIAAARAAGIQVLGYVDTSYKTVALATVEADITGWASLYTVDGIFVDQTTSDGADITGYYQDIYDHAKATVPGPVIMNPGTDCDEAFTDVADVLMNFEGLPASYRTRTVRTWEKDYPPEKFWHAVHTIADTTERDEMLGLTRLHRAGYVYLTDADMPNPYDVIPAGTWWTDLVEAMRVYPVTASLGGLTATATGTVVAEEVTGTADAALGTLGATAAGTVTAHGVAAADLGALAATATGVRTVVATSAADLGAVTATATGARDTFGTAAAALGTVTGTASGTVIPEEVTGTALADLGGLTAAASGARTVVGVAAADLGALTADAAGTVIPEEVTGTSAAPLGGLSATASGSRTTFGTALADLGGLTGTATASGQVIGTAAATLGALTGTATGARTVDGISAASLGELTATAAGSVTGGGTSATADLGPLTATSSGSRTTFGTVLADLGGLTGTAAGTVESGTVTGTAAALLGPLTATSSGVRTTTGVALADLGGLVAGSDGVTLIAGVGVADLGGLAATAEGFVPGSYVGPLRAGTPVATAALRAGTPAVAGGVHAGTPQPAAGLTAGVPALT